QLSEFYRTATSAEQLEISAAFGRGKIQNAGIGLLSDLPRIMEAAEKARTEATGEGDRAFNERLDNLGGQLNLAQGAVADFASALSQSGIFDVLGGGIVVFRELMESGTGIVRVWNEI